MSAHTEPHGGQPAGHETRDFGARVATLFFAGLAALVVVALVLMWGMFRYLVTWEEATTPPPPPLAATRPQQPPEPRLQPNPPVDLQAVHAAEEEQLNSYGWVQREAGVVRIPIERAKELLLERGLPVRPQAENPERARTDEGREER